MSFSCGDLEPVETDSFMLGDGSMRDQGLEPSRYDVIRGNALTYVPSEHIL